MGLALVVILVASMLIGSRGIAPGEVWHTLLDGPDAATASPEAGVIRSIVWEQRFPRTLLILIVGAALAVAGVLMQALTRNPLADPSILGVNAGASLAVVTAVGVFGISSIWFYLWFGFAGAGLAVLVVYLLGNANPLRLVLAGVALSMAVSSIVQLALISNQEVFNEFRFWAAGSFEGRGWSVVIAVVAFILVGLLLAWASAGSLNAIALGDEAGTALGVNVKRMRNIVVLSIALLAGGVTAAVGPVMFVGLGVPYVVRAITGPDLRWVIPTSMFAGPVVVGVADICARVIVAPQELQTGLVTAILGGPIFVALVRTKRGKTL